LWQRTFRIVGWHRDIPTLCQAHEQTRLCRTQTKLLPGSEFMQVLGLSRRSTRTWIPWISACQRPCTLDRSHPKYQRSTPILIGSCSKAILFGRMTPYLCSNQQSVVHHHLYSFLRRFFVDESLRLAMTDTNLILCSKPGLEDL
jgi:hypothetical protein